jgi:uncharacterized protein YbcV (DUF1398 family)
MFTIEQIKAAHSKVKSGADFPAYIKEIKAFGVNHYETFVCDGHIDYYGNNNYIVKAPPKYEVLSIAESPNHSVFKDELLAHQQGKTDFLSFIKMCAEMGVERWTVSIEHMTCTYFDKAGNEILLEEIPK